jgi:protein TonB
MKHVFILTVLLATISLDLLGQSLESGKFKAVEVQAEYPGGMQNFYDYISDSLKYPLNAKANQIEGVVYVQFVINSSGEIVDSMTQVVRTENEELNDEAVRLINNSSDWIPAKLTDDGSNIKQQRVMPIRFILPKEKKRRKR